MERCFFTLQAVCIRPYSYLYTVWHMLSIISLLFIVCFWIQIQEEVCMKIYLLLRVSCGNPVTRSTHTTNPSFTPRNSPTATPREAHVHANSKEFAYWKFLLKGVNKGSTIMQTLVSCLFLFAITNWIKELQLYNYYNSCLAFQSLMWLGLYYGKGEVLQS